MSKHDGESEDEILTLVTRAMHGDPTAIGELYRLYESRLEAAVRAKMGQKLRSKVETVDLIQSVWKDALPRIDEFEYRGPDSFFHWLATRVLHKIQDKLKYFAAEKRDPAKEVRLIAGSSSRGAPPPPAVEPSPSQVAMADEEAERLFRLLERLPAPQRQVIVRRIWDGMAFPEIAKIVGDSANTVRKRYELGMKKLQGLLDRDVGEDEAMNPD